MKARSSSTELQRISGFIRKEARVARCSIDGRGSASQ